jgi:ubiquinone/menaquinone biosynthesis C-methylase UbiE
VTLRNGTDPPFPRITVSDYIPPLRYRVLTRLYDPLVRLTTRESAFKRALLAQVEADRPRRVLDLGCGTGTLTIAIAKALPGATVTGLDADAEALEIAANKARRAGVDLSLHRGFSTDLPYDDVQFDCVVSSLFFHHLARDAKIATLREVRRVLASGGTLQVADWGKPANALLRTLFFVVQVLDGFETTRDSVTGALPDLMRAAGHHRVEETVNFATPLGTMRLFRAA